MGKGPKPLMNIKPFKKSYHRMEIHLRFRFTTKFLKYSEQKTLLSEGFGHSSAAAAAESSTLNQKFFGSEPNRYASVRSAADGCFFSSTGQLIDRSLR